MRYRAQMALLTALASIPASAWAQAAPASATVRTMPAGSSAHAHIIRPRGWVWGRPGWWGGSYQPPVRGYILPSFWLTPTYAVSDWPGYGFAEPGYGRRWVRYYDDAVLVDGRGMIYDSVSDVAWGRYERGPVPAYVGNAPDTLPTYGADYDHDDEVTWQGGSYRSDRQIWAWPSKTISANGNIVIVVPPGSTTTITFQPQQVVTTTTTVPTSYEPRSTPAAKTHPRVKEQPQPSAPPRVIGRVPVNKS
jgi:Ni/Co efflux regulator RcnB